MKIVVLQYLTGDVDIIDVPVSVVRDTFRQCVKNGEWDEADDWTEIMECYLSNWCKYDLANGDWIAENMDGSAPFITVHHLSHDDFNAPPKAPNRGIWDDALAMAHYRNRGNDGSMPIHDELLIVNKEMFGNEEEHRISFDFFDGYAIGSYNGESFVLIYPTLYDVHHLPDVERGICEYSLIEPHEITCFECGLKYGVLYKPEQLKDKQQ